MLNIGKVKEWPGIEVCSVNLITQLPFLSFLLEIDLFHTVYFDYGFPSNSSKILPTFPPIQTQTQSLFN